MRPDEAVQAVIAAQTMGSMAIAGVNKYRILVVTTGRILVLDTGKFSLRKALGVVAELPRSTRLGTVTGVNSMHKTRVGDETLYIGRQFWKDIGSVDAAAPAAD